jgi:O-antigen/teichoic acid export membrane protein
LKRRGAKLEERTVSVAPPRKAHMTSLDQPKQYFRPRPARPVADLPHAEGLKRRTIRAGAARFLGQGSRALLRLGTIVVLARLLNPSDFGLVAMVTVVTGVFEIFGTGGLSAATIQRAEISDQQISTLFWVNMAIGVLLALLCLAFAPLLNVFYQDPNTALVLVALAPNFIFNAAGVQHVALLQRQLHYTILSSIEVGSELVSGVISIGLALAGWSYWALVIGVLAGPLVITVGAWIATGWIPGTPTRDRDISSMLRFGGTITLNNFIVYVAYNLEKVLLGRYFGPEALGLYGRAYELINLPTRILNSAVGSVAFSALSRLQTDPARVRTYFLKGYSLVVSLTLPTTIVCAILADDIILVVLGPKWQGAAQIFRLLAPTILVFGMINPLAWLLQSSGLQERSLKIAFVICPIVIGSYLIGIPYGPNGVALAYSAAMLLWVIPHVFWCLHGTPITPGDLFSAIGRPLLAGVAAAFAGIFIQHLTAEIPFAFVRLALAGLAMAIAYGTTLLFVLGHKDLYVELLKALKSVS